ncbi:hypothetical protein AGMMS50262_05300 [Bacteroidia bacterium]|nr:hypothetical protein AGMMS50262_05300 [Bacteroidia bacterium]
MTIPQEKKDNEFSVDAQLRILKGKAIQLSFRIPLLGTEAFRVVITPDKLLIIDRLHKSYFSETMEAVKANADFDFDYYELEGQLTDKLFVPGRTEITPVKKKLIFPVASERYTMDLFYKTIDLNTPFSIDSSFPERYQRIPMSEAVQLIKNLL